MKTKVTFEFDKPEEAIAWMAKTFMPEEKPKAPVKNPSVEAGQAAQPPAAEGPKRGRGRPPKNTATQSTASAAGATVPDSGSAAENGAHGKATPDGTTERIAPPSTTPDPTTVATSSVASPPKSESEVKGAAAALSPGDVTSALQRVLTAKGMDAAQLIFQRHGVRRGADVKPEDRAKFIAYCDKVAKGEIDPAKGEGTGGA